MDRELLAAALLAFAVGLAHSLLGEWYILIRLFRRENLPRLMGSDRFTRGTLRFAWHLTTVAWWGFGALLLALASPATVELRQAALTSALGVFLVSAALALLGSRGRHLAWVAFLAIAALVWRAL